MLKICQMTWEKERVPDDWTKAVIILVYKGKGDRNECGSHRDISLMSIAGKVYGKIVIERVQKITERCISEEQGAFRKGRGCVDQIFSSLMRLISLWLPHSFLSPFPLYTGMMTALVQSSGTLSSSQAI